MLRPAASLSALTLLTGVAAADVPPPTIAAPPLMLSPTPIAFNWSGFYFGGHGGWSFGAGAITDGAVVGAHAGANWQYGNVVVGFEFGGSWVDWGSVDSVLTALGRGGLAFDRFLIYGAGGLGSQDLKALAGWVVGGGVEYAVTDNWTVGVEYLHYDFAGHESEVVSGRMNYLFGDANASYGGDFSDGGIFDEVRLGGLGSWPDSGEEGIHATAQLLFDPFVRPFDNRMLDVLLRPRPHIGGNASPDGTDQLFTGLTWSVPLGRIFFAEASLGGTVHNGPIKGELSLNCHALFRESLGAGANIGERWRVIASVDHSFCSLEHDALVHVGASIGYRF